MTYSELWVIDLLRPWVSYRIQDLPIFEILGEEGRHPSLFSILDVLGARSVLRGI